MSKPWFGVKKYGVGMSPASPAGWLALAVYVCAMIAVGPVVDALHGPVWAIFVCLGLLTAGLLLLVKLKGDGQPWKWRWGGR